ncbi:hypothetical protein COCON_G00200350 [Conger conger]|uniref:Uncharacterized protein n=1 Tax=Conger conger TaxID=82655 RepID=A0A9Q1HPM5_CONCO|nr:hypothetical protein COCON_G00200350 [Conger conger]
MVHEEFFARLNDIGYKNWVKAGCCLLKIKDGLHGYVNKAMKCFHEMLINNNHVLQKGQRCNYDCRPKGNQLYNLCKLCEEWRAEILRHHTNRTGVVNWGNCKPCLWPSHHWEIAKAYMPRGLASVTGGEQCDASALLNLITFCDYFSFINQCHVREVIGKRNELMHSCEMRVSAQWMDQYRRSLDQLLGQLRHIPELAATGREIHKMLSVDWTVSPPRVDCMDGLETDDVSQLVDGPVQAGLEAGDVSQLESVLLRERLQELLHCTQLQDPPDPQGLQELQGLRDFLQSQRDLGEKFQTELLSLGSGEPQPHQTGTAAQPTESN